MAESLPHQLLDELGILDLSKEKVKKACEANNISDSSSDDEEEATIEQEFSRDYDPRPKLFPVAVTSVLSPSRFVLKLQENATKKPSVNLSTIYEDFKWRHRVSQEKGETEKVVGKGKTNVEQDIFAKNKYVIVDTGSWGKAVGDDDVGSSDEDDCDGQLDGHSTGLIMSHSLKDRTYQVFLCNLGTISTCAEFDLCPVPSGHEFLLENPVHVLLTIPGLVPRKRMDNIPGLSQMNIQDREWSKGAQEDVAAWLSKYKTILLRELIQESPCLYFGDLYGSNETVVKASSAEGVKVKASEVKKDDLLSSYLTRQKNAFVDYQLLNRIYATLN